MRGDGMRCRGSRTWHVEVRTALVHSKHVGACANIDTSVLGLDVLNSQDSIEVHGPVGKFPVANPGPDKCVGRRLRRRQTQNLVFIMNLTRTILLGHLHSSTESV